MSFTKKRHFVALVKKVLFPILLFALISIILVWFLEFRYFNDFNDTWNFVFKNSGIVFLFNSFIMLVLIAFIYALTLKPWLSIGIISILVVIFSYINENKLASRMTPLLPEDLELAAEVSSLTKFVNITGLLLLFLGIIAVIIAAIILSRLTKRFFALPSYLTIKKDGSKKRFVLLRIFLCVFVGVVFFTTTNFIINNSGSKYQHVDLLNTTFTAWNQDRNYRENGFLIGFLYNFGKFKAKKPPEYSEKYINVIAEKYNKLEKQNNDTLKSLSDTDYNIVIVLNESFYDPTILSDYYQYSGGDITPNLHKITKKYPSGQMYSLDYGGGTANIEFETLTGLTNYYINTVPYTNLIPKAGQIPSIATWGKKNGYGTTAIHTYYGGMYKRNISLANEGFDNFITSLEIENPETEPGSEYQNDRTAYNEVLDVLDKNDQKQIVVLITMQNHTPFGEDLYDGERDFKILDTSDFDNPEDIVKIETYFQLLHNSDKYLGEFIEKLEGLNEKTVVLFFGDHSPGTFQKVAENDIRLSRMTPYFIYSNFDLGSTEKDLPTTTPNCLVNTLYNQLGVKKPTINYLLDDVCEKHPILTPSYFIDGEPMQTKVLNEYENITYDILSGKKYWMNITDW